MAEERIQRRLAAILAADVVGYSAMVGADEAGTVARVKALFSALIVPLISSDGGRLVKLMGDGMLAEFPSAVGAVRCALAIQSQMRDSGAPGDGNKTLELRIGVNVGDVIIDDDDIHGEGVNVAARLESLCDPGDVFVSSGVFDQVVGKLEAAFDDLGERQLKNISRPVRVYRARTGPGGTATLHPAPASPPPDGRPTIAVLPFNSMSGDPEQESFANGMTEDLTTDLSKVSGLFVIARTSTSTLSGETPDPGSIAKALGVRYILEGSVRKSGERVRVNAQLIDTVSGGHLWADRYDGTVHNVFELQDEVGGQVVAALSVKLGGDEREQLRKVHTQNLEAYELFVKAKATPYPPVPERIAAAREMHEEVIRLDPDFAGGYAGVASMLVFGVLWSHGDKSELIARAESLARKAIETDESFAWSHTALGGSLLLQGRYEEAIDAAQRAVSLQPSDADGHAFLGVYTCLAGEHARSEACVQRALQLNPRFIAGPYLNILGQNRAIAGRYREALEALEFNVKRQGPIGPPAYCSFAASYHALGRRDEAGAMVARLHQNHPEFSLDGWNFGRLIRPDGVRDRFVELMIDAGIRERGDEA